MTSKEYEFYLMKQHYIPRCYLRRFSDNEKSIYTYDKVNAKSYNASLMSVSCEEDLYTLSDEYVKKCREEAHGKRWTGVLWRQVIRKLGDTVYET